MSGKIADRLGRLVRAATGGASRLTLGRTITFSGSASDRDAARALALNPWLNGCSERKDTR